MYEVIYMKAEFEPWWMFEGWEENILRRKKFDNKIDATHYLDECLLDFRTKYKHEQEKKQCFAFWSDDERSFCEACDDDLQIYHGLFILFDGKLNV